MIAHYISTGLEAACGTVMIAHYISTGLEDCMWDSYDCPLHFHRVRGLSVGQLWLSHYISTGLEDCMWDSYDCPLHFHRVRGLSVGQLWLSHYISTGLDDCMWDCYDCPTTWAATCCCRRSISISGGWVLLCKALITFENSPHRPVQCITKCWCSVGVPAGASVLVKCAVMEMNAADNCKVVCLKTC